MIDIITIIIFCLVSSGILFNTFLILIAYYIGILLCSKNLMAVTLN